MYTPQVKSEDIFRGRKGLIQIGTLENMRETTRQQKRKNKAF